MPLKAMIMATQFFMLQADLQINPHCICLAVMGLVLNIITLAAGLPGE